MFTDIAIYVFLARRMALHHIFTYRRSQNGLDRMPVMIKKVFLGVILSGVVAIVSPSMVFAGTNGSIESQIRTHFESDQVMINIARCESEFTQFRRDGSVLRGGYKGRMIGIYQIAPMHIPDATRLGFDVETVEGNIGYAQYLYDLYGTSPWLDSAHCWKKLSTSPAPPFRTAKTSSVEENALSSEEREKQLVELKFQIARMKAVIDHMISMRNKGSETIQNIGVAA